MLFSEFVLRPAIVSEYVDMTVARRINYLLSMKMPSFFMLLFVHWTVVLTKPHVFVFSTLNLGSSRLLHRLRCANTVVA
jgi:hypothetical protein